MEPIEQKNNVFGLSEVRDMKKLFKAIRQNDVEAVKAIIQKILS